MKKLILTIAVVVSIFALHISCYAGEVPLEVREAGIQGISIFLKDTRIKGLHRLGFESKADIDDAAIGQGFQVFTIPTDQLLNDLNAEDFQSLATPTNLWQLLVLNGKKANALLTVDLVDGKWTPVEMGASGLAKELSMILEAWPETSGYQYRLIRVYQAKSAFVELSQDDKLIGIVPLTSLNAAIDEQKKGFDPIDIQDAKEVLGKLRPAVRRNVHSEQ